ncbi:MAG: glycine cleavage system aminomethyltransferase GcvT, partial [Anaerolineae bacterium]
YSDDDQRLEIILPRARAPELWNLLLEKGVKPAGLQVREALREEAGLPSYGDSPVDGLSLYRNGYASLFALSKPYFVGQKAIVQEVKPKAEKREFVYEPEEGEPRRTPLYPEHLKLTKKVIPFAGWEMPVWYTSIAEEHKAVRERAGLFDVGHMGVLEIAGPQATRFLDVVTSNYISWLKDGQSMYGYILNPDGHVMDDVMVYRRAGDLYMMVTNAVNQEKILAWLLAVNSREFLIDRDYPFREIEGSVTIRDLKDPSCGEDQRIDMALQGPNSPAILRRLIEDPRLERTLSRLRRSEFIQAEILGLPLIISRTGYTGEEIGFEFYIHPHDAVLLWQRLLEVGEDLGIKPAGLGARDSTRTEAGLPLYGHELAGPHDISPLEAGYGPFVKFHKPFFIGRKALLEKEAKREMEILRFRLNTRGGHMLKQGDLVVDRRGRYMGTVTSCALVDGYQLGMAYARRKYNREGTRIGVFALPRERPVKPIGDLALGDTAPLHQEATVLTRFPEPEERVRRPGEE